MAKRAVIDIVNRRLHLCGPGGVKIELPPGSQFFELEQAFFPGHLLLPVSDFHTIKPPGDQLAPQPPVVALTTTEASADPKGGTRIECPPRQIRF
eukprot:4558168-Lingulodinium_polyedra.AAC.1